MHSDYNLIVQLITNKENDYDFNETLNKSVKLDNSDMVIQAEKWVIYLTQKMIDTMGNDYFENLLSINEFWITLGQSKNYPYIYQSVNNEITPKEYYTDERYKTILDKQIKWLHQERQKIIEEEN